MRCFFLPDTQLYASASITLPEPLKHHLCRVLRLAPGAEFQLFDGRGRVVDAVLRSDGKADLHHPRSYPPPSCALTLIQGVPKGDKAELILQKGTELGVSCFHLVTMVRSIGRLKREPRQHQRWEKIIQEAARQCRQYHLPQLLTADSFENALATTAADIKLLLWEQSARPVAEVLGEKSPRSIAVVVGPEGGISGEEAEQARTWGYQAVSLGPRILRTETAGLAMIAILQYLYGDLSSA